jgi:hypothetical protein
MKKNLFKFFPIFLFTTLFPVVAFAATTFVTAPAVTCSGTGLSNLICQIQNILNQIVPVLVALGVVYFVWGVVNYVIADGEEAKKKGKDIMIYGIIGLAVIIGLWGLVNILIATFGLTGAAPSFNVNGGAGACTVPVSGAVGSTFQVYVSYIVCIINNSIIPLMFALAVVFFVWGAIKFFIINADEEAKREQGKQFMVWGIVALAVMLSVWGLVNILGVTFGISSSGLPHVTPPGSTTSSSPDCIKTSDNQCE